MRADLSDAYAGIEWANSQIKILKARIEAWRHFPAYRIVEEIHAHNAEKVYKLADVRPLPSIINAEAGLIINSLRSGLDVLANTLARRNGHVDPKHTQFPISPSASAFRHGKHAGHKEIRLLSGADRKIIEGLQPWAGGHASLFDLHTLDNTRKHRRLISAYVDPVGMSVGNIERKSGFRFAGAWKGFENDSIVGWAKIDAPKPDLDIALEVTLDEGHAFPSKPLLAALHEFTRATESIINLFDV